MSTSATPSGPGSLGGVFLSLSYFGTDQSQVQRYLAGASLRESRLGLMFNAVLKIPMQFFILLLGVLVFVFYQFEQPPVFFNQAVWRLQRPGYNRSGASRPRNPIRRRCTPRSAGRFDAWLAARDAGDGTEPRRERGRAASSAAPRPSELRPANQALLTKADPRAPPTTPIMCSSASSWIICRTASSAC